MSDISKCSNEKCLIRDKCYRYRASSSTYQSFLIIDHDVTTEEDCDSYWKCDNDKDFEKLEKYWADF